MMMSAIAENASQIMTITWNLRNWMNSDTLKHMNVSVVEYTPDNMAYMPHAIDVPSPPHNWQNEHRAMQVTTQ